MTIDYVTREAEQIRRRLLKDESLARCLDKNRDYIPVPKLGTGEIKLIIVGQDPTVKNEKSRDAVKTVLNLDKRTSLYEYISYVAKRLGYDIEQNVYATNLLKCFYASPPATIPYAVREHTPYWIDLLKRELAEFPDAKIITLGEPVLAALVTDGSSRVRDYWGYQGSNLANILNFRYCEAANNLLQRRFFPLPHQPSIRKQFYRNYMAHYIAFLGKA